MRWSAFQADREVGVPGYRDYTWSERRLALIFGLGFEIFSPPISNSLIRWRLKCSGPSAEAIKVHLS